MAWASLATGAMRVAASVVVCCRGSLASLRRFCGGRGVVFGVGVVCAWVCGLSRCVEGVSCRVSCGRGRRVGRRVVVGVRWLLPAKCARSHWELVNAPAP